VVGKKEEENIAAVMVMVMVVSIVGVVGDYIYKWKRQRKR
jgi:hypothetical protein